jgi:hypothetical protein
LVRVAANESDDPLAVLVLLAFTAVATTAAESDDPKRLSPPYPVA